MMRMGSLQQPGCDCGGQEVMVGSSWSVMRSRDPDDGDRVGAAAWVHPRPLYLRRQETGDSMHSRGSWQSRALIDTGRSTG